MIRNRAQCWHRLRRRPAAACIAPSEDGFTLLETLVALALLVMIAAGFYRGLSAGVHGMRVVERDAAALAVARGLLAATGLDGPLASGTSSGTAPGGISWTRRVAAYSDADARAEQRDTGAGAGTDTGTDTGASPALTPRLYRIDVDVAWRDVPGRPVRRLALTTLKSTESEP